VSERVTLPPVETIDEIPTEALPAVLAHLLALQARVVARLAAAPKNSDRTAEPPYTLTEAAALLRKSPPWLRRRAKAGAIPCAKKIGKSWAFPRPDFLRYCERRHVG
jgi:helix-turn-helix protein